MTQTAKHTPGPWVTFKLNDGRIAVNSPSEEQHICQTVYEGTEHEANAQLIAAAPDMVEALKFVKSQIEKMPATGDIVQAVCKIDAALAKAGAL